MKLGIHRSTPAPLIDRPSSQGEGSPSGHRWPPALMALRHPHYRSLWFSIFASFSAVQMQQVARGWLTAELTGNKALALGLVGLAYGLPQLAVSLFGGAYADRFDKRKILILGQVAMGLLALVNALLLSFHLIQVWHLIVLGILQGSVFAFNMPARQSMMPRLLSGRELMNGIALNNAAMTSMSIVAPAVTGILIAIPWVGLERVYYIIAGLYCVVIYGMTRLPKAPPDPTMVRRPVMEEIGAGLAYTRSNHLLFTYLMLSLLVTLLGMPYMTLLPLFARTVYDVGSRGLGLMSTFVGVGALAGAVFVAVSTGYSRKTMLQLMAGVGMGLFLALFAFAPTFPIALVGLALMGFCNTTFGAINGTMLMVNTEEQYYGRVMSLSMMTFSAMPIGGLIVSAAAGSIGAPLALGISAAMLGTSFILVALFSQRFRVLDTTPKADPATAR